MDSSDSPWRRGLERTFDFLAANPRASLERDEFSPPVRLHPFGVHLVVYRIVGEEILILRVLHGRQDWAEYL
jgi:toxin ParE1/3/4